MDAFQLNGQYCIQLFMDKFSSLMDDIWFQHFDVQSEFNCLTRKTFMISSNSWRKVSIVDGRIQHLSWRTQHFHGQIQHASVTLDRYLIKSLSCWLSMGISINRGTPIANSWMVFVRKHPTKMDDLGVPPIYGTPKITTKSMALSRFIITETPLKHQ